MFSEGRESRRHILDDPGTGANVPMCQSAVGPIEAVASSGQMMITQRAVKHWIWSASERRNGDRLVAAIRMTSLSHPFRRIVNFWRWRTTTST
jgi:hypothetical protein